MIFWWYPSYWKWSNSFYKNMFLYLFLDKVTYMIVLVPSRDCNPVGTEPRRDRAPGRKLPTPYFIEKNKGGQWSEIKISESTNFF